jgi:hypothetical protein
MPIKIRGTSLKGEIKEIYTDLAKVQWKGNRPMFVVVQMVDGSVSIAHPSQLKRWNRK